MKGKLSAALGIVVGIAMSMSSLAYSSSSNRTSLNNTSLAYIKPSSNIKPFPHEIEDLKMVQENAKTKEIKQETNTIKKSKPNQVAKTNKTNSTRKVASRGNNMYGELLDWWKSARYIFPIGSVAEVTDLYTGKTFKVKRTMGTNHADCEALTREDTRIIASIWDGFSWNTRPVIVSVNGRRIAASMSSLPHAGIDSAPAFKVVSNRSQGYGRGENLDVVKNNGMNGHFDIHFLNSTTHKTGKENPEHQKNVLKAAGK